MDTILALLPAQNIISEQLSRPATRVSPAASPKQLLIFPRRHDRNRGEQPSGQATAHNTPAYNEAVESVERCLNGGLDEGGGGTGFPGTVLPSTEPFPSSPAMQLEHAREHSPPAGRASSRKGAIEGRGSRSASRVRRVSIGSINEEITGAFSPLSTRLFVVADQYIPRYSSIISRQNPTNTFFVRHRRNSEHSRC
jgi:hypothetical protein